MALPTVLTHSAALRLFAMLRYDNGSVRLQHDLEDHLAWMIAREREGAILLSGPIAGAEDGMFGLTVLRAADLGEARAVADDDPFAKRGLMRYDLVEWTAYEGRIDVRIRLSDSRVELV